VVGVCFVAAGTGKELEERGEELFVVQIDPGNPFASAVGIAWAAVGSPAVETKTQLAVAHNPSVATKIRKHLGVLLAETLKSLDAVLGNRWAGEVTPRQNRSASED